MNFYQEITLLPDTEVNLGFIWQKTYQQLHLALVENKISEHESAIALSFSKYGGKLFPLGDKLRLFAQTEEQLQKFDVGKWLNRLTDYTHLSRIRQVPEKIEGHACFKHVKPKGSKENLARRRAKRKGETLQQALAYFESYEEKQSRLPYIHMHSETNGHRFRLYIEQQTKDQPQSGLFSCYGLSGNTTVPMF
ncbi:MAG: type I-F CRISPR-associated endoribonuclease Cas6/Csy4 [Sedimenticola sp.]